MVRLVAAAAVLTVVCFHTLRSPPQRPIQWTPGPDFLPLGTVIQGGTVEFNVSLFADVFTNQRPTWTSHLPNPLRQHFNRVIYRSRAATGVRGWRMQVNAPDFLQVNQTGVDYHYWGGPFPSVALHFVTEQSGNYHGDIEVTLSKQAYQTTTVRVPVSVKVLGTAPQWSVLLTDSPFDRYGAADGRELQPVSELTSRLAQRGVRVDVRHAIPESLAGWNVIMVSDDALSGTVRGVDGVSRPRYGPETKERLHQFVARGGRLIVVAYPHSTYMEQTVNDLTDRYGLHVASQEIGPEIVATEITPDPLTRGVSRLCFWSPAYVWSVDATQAKVLAVRQGDAEIGIIAVSRAPDRGEVIVMSPTLWWYRLSRGPADGDNLKLFENLLSP